MTDEAPSPLGVVRTGADVLDAAAKRVTGHVDAILAAEGIKRHDALDYLGTLVAEVSRKLQEPDAATTVHDVRSDPLFTPLLDALAHETLHMPEGTASASATIDVLRAIEVVRSAGDGSDPISVDGLEDLRARLRAPDAFELLVEVVHDFRSPLTSILFLAETLRDGHSGPVTDHQRSQVGLVYGAAFGLASVASDVMDLARNERDIIDEETEPYALAEVFQSVQRLVGPIVDEKGLALRVVVPERAQAHGHPQALSRVLLNLATNALKFTDEGSVEMGVIIRPHSRLEFYVQDTGRGIPEERRPELFQPFKRRSNEARDGHFFSGSGVGLSIARRLVRAMGSELHFESSNETGTRFSFTVVSSAER